MVTPDAYPLDKRENSSERGSLEKKIEKASSVSDTPDRVIRRDPKNVPSWIRIIYTCIHFLEKPINYNY